MNKDKDNQNGMNRRQLLNAGAASLAAMAISFFLFEAYMLTYRVTALPGTVMILVGWIVLVSVKMLTDTISKAKTSQGS